MIGCMDLKKMVNEGSELFWHVKDFYLGMKLLYEPNAFTDEEKAYAYNEGILSKEISRHFLDIKIDKEIITPEEEVRWHELTSKFMENNMTILKQELQNAGSSLVKLHSQNKGLYNHLLEGTLKYLPERLNYIKNKPIYFDWKGYLHVFIRHVEEFKINNAFDGKDKFLWDQNDVMTVIKNVIGNVDDEVQQFWKEKPNHRFSKYGAKSLYFEGDYYTFHVESDGRLSTFHRTKKRI